MKRAHPGFCDSSPSLHYSSSEVTLTTKDWLAFPSDFFLKWFGNLSNQVSTGNLLRTKLCIQDATIYLGKIEKYDENTPLAVIHVSRLYFRILKAFDQKDETLRKIANWITQHFNNDINMFKCFGLGPVKDPLFREQLHAAVKKTLLFFVSQISVKKLKIDENHKPKIIAELCSAWNFRDYLISKEDFHLIAEKLISLGREQIDQEDIEEMTEEIVRRLLSKPLLLNEQIKSINNVFKSKPDNLKSLELMFKAGKLLKCNLSLYPVSKNMVSLVRSCWLNQLGNPKMNPNLNCTNIDKFLKFWGEDCKSIKVYHYDDTKKAILTSNLCEKALALLHKELPHLERLSFRYIKIHTGCCKIFPNFSKLTYLDLEGCYASTGNNLHSVSTLNLDFVKDCSSLQELHLRSTDYYPTSIDSPVINKESKSFKVTLSNGYKWEGIFENGKLKNNTKGSVTTLMGNKYQGMFFEGGLTHNTLVELTLRALDFKKVEGYFKSPTSDVCDSFNGFLNFQNVKIAARQSHLFNLTYEGKILLKNFPGTEVLLYSFPSANQSYYAINENNINNHLILRIL